MFNSISKAKKKLSDFWELGENLSLTKREPHCCPVCGGRGLVAGNYYELINTGSPLEAKCRTCGGSGIVWG